VLEVVDPGPLLTLQDAGRPGLAHLGIPPSGAADPFGFAVANALIGAPVGATTLEVTLGGAVLLAVETCAVAIGGADLGAVRDDGRRLAAGAVHRLSSGARIRFEGGTTGMRAYLGLAGGVAAASVLGSASTWAPGAPHGVLGTALRPGGLVRPARPRDLEACGRAWPADLAPHPAATAGSIRFVPGPDAERLPAGAREAFTATEWRASAATDRMGIRLDGGPLRPGEELLSHPVLPGAVQVPPDGRPLVLLVDGPTIGGYPVIGVVPRAELPRLGQVRPGDALRFEAQGADEARVAWRQARSRFEAAIRALAADALWTRLEDNAAG
jgi:biotin-dependent carboxylase-like uncharacterized protein